MHWKALSLKRYYLQTHNQILFPSEVGAQSTSGTAIWILASNQCSYRHFPLTGVPANDWLGAVNLAIAQWSPYASTGRYIVFGNTGAMVWVWDQQKVAAAIAEKQLSPETQVIPEPLFYSPMGDGARLLKTQGGLDAQVWVAGELLESISFQSLPTERQIKILQANFSAISMADLSEPRILPFVEEVWGRNLAIKEIRIPKQAQVIFVGATAVYFVALTWQLLNLGVMLYSTGQLESEIAKYRQQIGEVIDARESALKDAERVNYLNKYLNQIPQTQILAGVLDKIPRNGTVLERWQYQEGDLAFTVRGPSFDPRYYVQAMESLPYISDVSAQTGSTKERLSLKAKVAEEEIELSDRKL
jgi:hypothetical protein